MGKKIVEIVAESTTNQIIRILKEYRAAGKSLDDVIIAFEKRKEIKTASDIGGTGAVN